MCSFKIQCGQRGPLLLSRITLHDYILRHLSLGRSFDLNPRRVVERGPGFDADTTKRLGMTNHETRGKYCTVDHKYLPLVILVTYCTVNRQSSVYLLVA
jgi:hypothetical protein